MRLRRGVMVEVASYVSSFTTMFEGDLHVGYEQTDDVEMQMKGRSYSIKKTFKE